MSEATKSDVRAFEIDGIQVEIDLAAYSSDWNAGHQAMRLAEKLLPEAVEPAEPELREAEPPAVALHRKGGAFLRTSKEEVRGKRISDQTAHMAVMFEREGEVAMAEFTREQLRVLVQQGLKLLTLMDENAEKIAAYREKVREYEDSDKIRRDKLEALKQKVQATWNLAFPDNSDWDEDDEDDDEPF